MSEEMKDAVVEKEADTLESPEISTMSDKELDTILSDAPIHEKKGEDRTADDETTDKTSVDTKTDTIKHEVVMDYKGEYERLKKKAENQDMLIARQGNELGALRKQTVKDPDKHKEKLDEINTLFLAGEGVEATQKLRELEEDEKRMKENEEYQNMIETSNKNSSLLLAVVPDFETQLEDISKILAEDNVTPHEIEGFKQSPYLMHPAITYNLYKRLALSKENKFLKEQVDKLSKERDELRLKPDAILENIEKASRTKTITGKSTGASVGHPIYGKEIHQMSNAELDNILDGG